MDQFPSNRGWMHDRCYIGRGALKESFAENIVITMMGKFDVHVVSATVQGFWRKEL